MLAQVVVADSLDQEFTAQEVIENATIFRADGHMHQSKFAVGKVKVKMQTLALTFDQIQPLTLRIATNPQTSDRAPSKTAHKSIPR